MTSSFSQKPGLFVSFKNWHTLKQSGRKSNSVADLCQTQCLVYFASLQIYKRHFLQENQMIRKPLHVFSIELNPRGTMSRLLSLKHSRVSLSTLSHLFCFVVVVLLISMTTPSLYPSWELVSLNRIMQRYGNSAYLKIHRPQRLK